MWNCALTNRSIITVSENPALKATWLFDNVTNMNSCDRLKMLYLDSNYGLVLLLLLLLSFRVLGIKGKLWLLDHS